MSKKSSTDDINIFINSFNKNVSLKSDTLLKRIGIQYKEVYYNQLLAFYLNPNEEHGYGNKILRALLKSANIKENLDLTNMIFERPNYYETESGKQIDICAHNDSWGLIIENKIYANLDNPFEEYVKKINSLNEKNFRILLYIRDYEEEELKKAKEYGFILVHYEVFIRNIRELNLDCKNKWQMFFEDMIETLDSICSPRTDVESMKWIKENSETIAKYYKTIKKDENEKFEKYRIITDYLFKSINQKVLIINKKNNEAGWPVRNSNTVHKDEGNFYYISIIDIHIGKIKMALDNALGLKGWCINLNIRHDGKCVQKYKSIVIDKLKTAGIEINNNPQNPYTGDSHINLYDLGNDVSMEEILEINGRIIEALMN